MRAKAIPTETTVIKCDPGWYIAYYLAEEPEGEQLLEMPIIAWEIEKITLDPQGKNDPKYYYDAKPLTPEGEPDDGYNLPWCIKTPDGNYIFPQDTLKYSEHSAIQHFELLHPKKEE